MGLDVELVTPPTPPYRILDRGANAAYQESEPRAFLANTPTRLAEVWNLVVANRLPRPPAPSRGLPHPERGRLLLGPEAHRGVRD
jgi:hypothetical protein